MGLYHCGAAGPGPGSGLGFEQQRVVAELREAALAAADQEQ